MGPKLGSTGAEVEDEDCPDLSWVNAKNISNANANEAPAMAIAA